MTREPFTVEEINVVTDNGTKAERGMVHRLVPGLAVTMHHFGEFDVTHVATGKKVAGPYELCCSAVERLAVLGYCMDWTQDAAGIKAQLAAHGDEPANAPGYTLTGQDGTRPQTKREIIVTLRSDILGDEFPWEETSPWQSVDTLLDGLAAVVPS